MLDHYQIQLTRMLEAEQYSEAKKLIRFLLHCKGEDERHYEEWGNLLSWLEVAFPEQESGPGIEEEDEEEDIRRSVLKSGEQDESYVKQVLHIIQHHPMPDQQILALERAVHLNHPEVDPAIIEWLSTTAVHPAVQFKALQCLKRHGASGMITLARMDERVELDIESTPLSLEEFPDPVIQALERVESSVDTDDPTLPHFARELWKDLLQYLYGTSSYRRMLENDTYNIDCWAAALHLTLLITVYGKADDDATREAYGISEPMRFSYEQACRALRHVIGYGPFGGSHES
ncbi:hypothetical protein HUB94_19615 (plasmid) [Paenibacillus cellulosilyticus]|nr:hypothetical protein HUB94_19615 [Paenibacillus cellulosilyticus]